MKFKSTSVSSRVESLPMDRKIKAIHSCRANWRENWAVSNTEVTNGGDLDL